MQKTDSSPPSIDVLTKRLSEIERQARKLSAKGTLTPDQLAATRAQLETLRTEQQQIRAQLQQLRATLLSPSDQKTDVILLIFKTDVLNELFDKTLKTIDLKALAMAKAVQVAKSTHLTSGGQVISVDVEGQRQAFYASIASGNLSVVTATPLPEGGDARPYIIGTAVLKTPHETPQARAAVQQEGQLLRTLDRSQPGGDHVIELHTVTDARGGAAEGVMLKYYSLGDFKGHIAQQAFLNEVLGISDLELQAIAPELRLSALKAAAEKHKDGIAAFVTKYNPRESPDAFIERLAREYRPMTPSLGVAVAEQLSRGLLFLHRQGILHGDVKGENVLWEQRADGSLHFVHADLSKANRVRDRRQLLEAARHIRFVSSKDHPESKQIQSLCGALNGMMASKATHQITNRQDLMNLMERCGVLSRNQKVWTADPTAVRRLDAVIQNPSQMSQLEKVDPALHKRLMRAGVFTQEEGNYKLNISLSESVGNEAKEIFKFVGRPRMGVPGTVEYSNPADEQWIDQFGREGQESSYLQALQSNEVYAFGVTWYEMATGIRLQRPNSALVLCKVNFRALGCVKAAEIVERKFIRISLIRMNLRSLRSAI